MGKRGDTRETENDDEARRPTVRPQMAQNLRVQKDEGLRPATEDEQKDERLRPGNEDEELRTEDEELKTEDEELRTKGEGMQVETSEVR